MTTLTTKGERRQRKLADETAPEEIRDRSRELLHDVSRSERRDAKIVALRTALASAQAQVASLTAASRRGPAALANVVHTIESDRAAIALAAMTDERDAAMAALIALHAHHAAAETSPPRDVCESMIIQDYYGLPDGRDAQASVLLLRTVARLGWRCLSDEGIHALAYLSAVDTYGPHSWPREYAIPQG